jgi:hypothetical protein
MLTVRHIYASGHEEIHLTNRVSFQPFSAEGGSPPKTVFWERQDGSTVPLTDGSVYVMNDLGKTVAKYSLTEETIAP